MFIQSCFIRKCPDQLRAQLEELGYKLFGGTLCEDYCIFTMPQYGRYRIEVFSNITDENTKGFIDCGTNENLFLAIAALRDDTDYMQYFICAGNFVLCNRDKWSDMYSILQSRCKYSAEEIDNSHKATVGELIELFAPTDNSQKERDTATDFRCISDAYHKIIQSIINVLARLRSKKRRENG